jgi:hypothetical protein
MCAKHFFQRNTLLGRSTHKHGQPRTAAVMRQPLAQQRKMMGGYNMPKLSKQAISAIRVDLYFQLDH